MPDQDIRVLIVDDTATYRKIVRDALTGAPGIEVVGTAANGKIALTKIQRLRPHLLTLDLEMPEMDGLELLRQLKQSGSRVGTIVLSGTSKKGASATVAALDLGAFDFVAKPAGGTPERNLQLLRQELCPRIEACARTRDVLNLLPRSTQTGSIDRKVSPSPENSSPQPSSSDDDNVADRMRRIIHGNAGRCEVVAVGISTGGPRALSSMLPHLPADLNAAVLIVQHMPPVFTKSLADDLDKHCALAVSEAVEGQPVLPGHVLIAPGGKQMKVQRQNGHATVCITDDPPENSCRPSVDYLFRSVTRAYGPNAVGVIMTGMGNDGAQGCRQMKQRGATIIAQDEPSCVVFGMPRQPIEEGIADVVAPLDRLAAEIVRIVGKGVAACM